MEVYDTFECGSALDVRNSVLDQTPVCVRIGKLEERVHVLELAAKTVLNSEYYSVLAEALHSNTYGQYTVNHNHRIPKKYKT